MPSNLAPIPANEIDRISDLYDFDIDYSDLQSTFKDLTYLAAKISGTSISLVNLIDSYTQWSVANFGLDVEQMAREDSVCQYTILSQDHFEVENLAADERFNDKAYVSSPLNLRYYFGVPLRTARGQNIGSLCVLDPGQKKLTPEKIELLKIIAKEIVTRLSDIKLVQDLKNKLEEEQATSKKVAHDIRSPISGIIGITELVSDQGHNNELADVLEMINLIKKSSWSLLDLADEILSEKRASGALTVNALNLSLLKAKLLQLYTPQANCKTIVFKVNSNACTERIPFSRNKVLQISGNLIANAIKFTPAKGKVTVDLDLVVKDDGTTFKICVIDTGVGMTAQAIEAIMKGNQQSMPGTAGEMGYGFGLNMVKQLIEGLNGKLKISSVNGQGTKFEVCLPQH